MNNVQVAGNCVSVAGPLLYLLYTSLLKNAVAKHAIDISSFADDHVLLQSWISDEIAFEHCVIQNLKPIWLM